MRRAQLGVTVQPVTSDMAESLGLKQVGGAIVSGIEPGSAAEHAGLKRGDVIKSFNGKVGPGHQHAPQPRRRDGTRFVGDGRGGARRERERTVGQAG